MPLTMAFSDNKSKGSKRNLFFIYFFKHLNGFVVCATNQGSLSITQDRGDEEEKPPEDTLRRAIYVMMAGVADMKVYVNMRDWELPNTGCHPMCTTRRRTILSTVRTQKLGKATLPFRTI